MGTSDWKPDPEEIRGKLTDILRKVTCDESLVVTNQSLVTLPLDSLDSLDFAIQVQDAFDIKISNRTQQSWKTIDNVVDSVTLKLLKRKIRDWKKANKKLDGPGRKILATAIRKTRQILQRSNKHTPNEPRV